MWRPERSGHGLFEQAGWKGLFGVRACLAIDLDRALKRQASGGKAAQGLWDMARGDRPDPVVECGMNIVRATPADAVAVSALIHQLSHHFLAAPDGPETSAFLAATSA